MQNFNREDNKNYIIAILLSSLVFVVWFVIFQPKEANNVGENGVDVERGIVTEDKAGINETLQEYKVTPANGSEKVSLPFAGKIDINTESLDGSISLRGGRFDDLKLKKYRQELDEDSPEIVLLSKDSDKSYFADFGWLSADKSIKLPTYETVWRTKSKKLTEDKPVILTWRNNQGLTFKQTISVDENYMFNVQQSVINTGGRAVALVPYGRVKQTLEGNGEAMFILHEGAIGVFNEVLQEFSYKDLRKEDLVSFDSKDGWVGITSKYWLTAIVPDKNYSFKAQFSHKDDGFKSGYMGKELIVYPNQTITLTNNFFAGAKDLDLLDDYAENLDIKLFDRAVDFGWFYFITKPIYLALKWLYALVGNFGVAIILLTIFIKVLMYPIASKSFMSMAKMKKLQPEIKKMREKYKGDRARLNQETIALYKREQVNPAAGCLPLLIQIPVFFSLYKVLYVTIDMRHAPFFGWMKDLSLADTSSVWNLFGVLPWDAPTFMNIGILPILMSLTMWYQQRLSPQAGDAAQMAVIKWMPFIFLFLFAGFPSGLLVYWISSNVLAIGQQVLINRKIAGVK
jgi:YidC/Oxa1 family membrane protein insertase